MTTGRIRRQSGAGAAGAVTPSAAEIRFAPFCLDLRGGRLLRGSDPVQLRPKTWSVLSYLADRPGVLVSKGELMDAVWSDVTVTESVMSKSIGELRAALGDGAKAPRFIETIQRRGFRFIAPIDRDETPASDRPSAVASGWSSPDVGPTPARRYLVGRDRELGQLGALLAKAHDGERQLAFVTGSAGIGKTALVDAFLESKAVRESRRPIWLLRGACIEQHGPREPYMPVLEALERLAHHPDASNLRGQLRRVAPTWLAQMPWLVDADEMDALRQALQGVTSRRMLRELAILVETLATDVTLVLVLEDLHWCDPSTVDVLSMLGLRPEPARLLVLGTYRPADAIVSEHVLMSAVRTLYVHRQSVELPLDDLSEAAVSAYVEARFPGNDFAPALASVIRTHTNGNPLFMVGVIDHMLSRGQILDTAPGWALRAPLEKIDLGVPDDVRFLIEEQFRGLSPADYALLQAASVAGSEFTPLVLAAALGTDVADAELRCQGFARAQRFIRVAGRVEWPDRSMTDRYTFTHELYRQVVYADIAEAQCIRLHQRIGRALESAHGARRMEIAAQLAVHFERGRDDARALHYFGAAATRARERFASREAIGYLESAIALVALIPDDGERCRRELELRLSLGAARSDIDGFASESVREDYALAAELCAKVGTPAQLFDILYARWYFYMIRADRDESIAHVEQLRGLARRLRRSDCRAIADSAALRTALYDGRFRECADIADGRFASPQPAKGVTSPVVHGVAPSIAATSHHAIALWFLGHPERAAEIARATVERARCSGSAFTLTSVLVQTAIVELLCRNVRRGGETALEAGSLSSEHGFAFWNAVAGVLVGWAQVRAGKPCDGASTIEEGLVRMLGTGARYFSAFAYAFLAEAHLHAGTTAEGVAAADAGLLVTQTTLDRVYQPELWRLKGELLLRDDPHEAERCLARALELGRGADAKALELRAAISMARALTARGRVADARAVLAEAYRSFDARSRMADVVEARELLATLTSH